MAVTTSIEHPLDGRRGLIEPSALLWRQRCQHRAQGGDPSVTARQQRGPSRGARLEPDDPAVARLFETFDQAVGHECGDESRHRRRGDAFRRGQGADRPRTAEDEDGQGGQPRRRDACGTILLCQSPQEMEGGRVDPGRQLAVWYCGSCHPGYISCNT
jgi:hypothetical protein